MKKLISVLSYFLFAAASFAASYESGDWVFYRDFRCVLSVDKGREYVYFATLGGVTRWDFYRNRWDTPLTVALLPGEALAFDSVYVASYDENTGYLWCGTSEGLLSYSTMVDEWERHNIPLGDPQILSIGITDDNIWAEGGQPGYGVRMLFKGGPTGFFMVSSSSELYQAGPVDWQGERAVLPEEFTQYFVNEPGWVFRTDGLLIDMNLNEYQVTSSLADDGRGYGWLGFYGYGTGRVDNHTRRMDLHTAGPESTVVNAMFLDEKVMWLGGRGLTRWRRDSDEWDYYPAEQTTGFYSDYIADISRIGDKLYLATDLGLAFMDTKSGRFHTLNSLDDLWDSQITALSGDSIQLWIGTAQGLNVIRMNDNKMIRIYEERIKRLYINDVAVDGKFVWVGTEFGIYLHDRKRGDWTYVRGTPEMMDSPVKTIQAGKKEVWFGRDLGVEMFDKDSGAWKSHQAMYFGNRTPLSILAGDSLVWVGTDGGLYKFDRKLNRWYSYMTEDGMPSDTIRTIYQEGDYLWLGTTDGLCRFYWNDPYRLD